MSTHSQQQQQQQIMQACTRINQALQIPQQQFSLQSLTHLEWYLTVLQMIYPQLQKQFNKIKTINNEAMAFDKLLLMLANQQIIEEDFLQIKGQDIIQGDIQSVYYVVQLLSALIQRQNQEQQQQQQGQQGQQQHQQQDHEEQQQQLQHQQQSLIKHKEQQQYEQQFEPEQPSPQQQSPSNNADIKHLQQSQSQQLSHQPSQKYPSQAYPSSQPQYNVNRRQQQQQFKNPFYHHSNDSPNDHSSQQQQQQHHSVLGIHNQFQDQSLQQQQDNYQHNHHYQQQSSIKRPIGGGMSDAYPYNNYSKQSQQPNINFQPITKQSQQQQQYHSNQQYQQNNNYNQNNQYISSNQLISTKGGNNYKNIPKQNKPRQQQQNNKKQFSSSSQQQQQSTNNYNNQQIPSKYSKPQKQSQSEDENQYFINPTIKKYKSADKNIKQINTCDKKTIQKHNKLFQSPSSKLLSNNKSPKKLVAHPTIKKQLRKATNLEAKKLTNQVKSHITSTLKKKKQKPNVQSVIIQQSPTHQQMHRKRKQLKVKLTDYKQQKQLRNQHKLHTHTQNARSSIQLNKILKWRQGQLKKEKQQFQKAMQLKLQQQKQNYIKKINKLLIKLQKEKELYQQQTYKQKLFKQNQQAAKRLTAIQQWYKDRITMLKQKNSNNRNQRTLMHTGHKQILKQIEKDLKRDNQKQIMAMTMKYRRQQAQIENDLQELQREIIKVYKRN